MSHIGPTIFFEPSGCKSDAADPFSIIPKLSSAFLNNTSRRHRPSGLFNNIILCVLVESPPRPLASKRVEAVTNHPNLQDLKQAHKGEGLPPPYPLPDGPARRTGAGPRLKRPDGRCRRLGLSRNAELSFGTIENGSAASDLPPEGSKKKSWADLTHLAHFAKSKPRDYRKWIRSMRFTPKGSDKKDVGRFHASGAFR